VNLDEEKWKKAIFWVFDAPDMAMHEYEVTLVWLP
jgi:hypothetical protein